MENAAAKLRLAFTLLLPLVQITAFGQAGPDSANDDNFNIFLLIFGTVVLCGLFGAAFVGALVAGLVAFGVAALISFGIVSTSVAIAVYRKSLPAGFKTFLMIGFGFLCGVSGAVIAFVVQYNTAFAPSVPLATGLGFIGGGLGGVLLTIISINAVRYLIAKAAAKHLPH